MPNPRRRSPRRQRSGDPLPQPRDVDQATEHLTLAEETLEAHVVERHIGNVLIHTRVETQPVTAQVNLHHDEVVIDRVAVNEHATERRGPWYEGETLMVPVYEEVLVTRTQLVLREIVQVRNRGRVEPIKLKGSVRREVVDIEEEGV